MITEELKHITVGTVVSVNKFEYTCVVKIEGSDETINDVRLLAASDEFENPMVAFPKVNSLVGIVPMFNSLNVYGVFVTTEVDELVLRGDEFGGLVKVEAVTSRLNAIEQKLNNQISKWNAFAAAYVPGSPSSVGTPPSLATQTITPVAETERSQIENEKVKHG
jgi:hypothetical protein